MANNPLARYAVPIPRNPLAPYAKSEKNKREAPAPPATSGRAVQRAVRNAEYRRLEAKRQKAIKVLAEADKLDKQWEREYAERVRKERAERAVRPKETPEARKQRKDAARARDAFKREQWKKIEKDQWISRKLDKSNDPDPFDDRPKKTMNDNLDYKTHRQAAAIKRGGAEPMRLANALRTGTAIVRGVARALPIAGAIATGYDVANMLGGPPVKDPSKFRNYRGFPGTVKTPKVKK